MGLGINDKYRFTHGGWYYVDLEAEIAYWSDARNDPDGYDTTLEEAEAQLESSVKQLNAFEWAFEAQRTDKVDYGDGSWV